MNFDVNRRVAAPLLATLLLLSPTSALCDESGTVEQIISILRHKGLIDQEEQERLLLKNRAQAPSVEAGASVLDGWDFYGDFRLRHELFTFRHDPNGQHRDNRYRFRYRVRLGFEKKLSDTLDFGMRFATGGTPSSSQDRSTNQTLGREEDFDYDSVRIARAYFRWQLPEVVGLRTRLVAGKIANPFVWKKGQDRILWDSDIEPEGAALLLDYPLDERSRLFGRVGYFIDDENATDADPKLVAVQLGGSTEIGDLELGLRGSLYWWRSLDSDFIFRSEEFGNLPTSFQGGKARVGDVSVYVATDLGESWPALLYGSYTKNFTADSGFCTVFDAGPVPDGDVDPINCDGPGFAPPAGSTVLGAGNVGAEDDAWGVGIELGSARKIAKLGFGYFYIEANAVMSLFTDTGFLDGTTNRRAWIVYGSRALTDNTVFKVSYYRARYAERDSALYRSTSFSDRSRVQTDVVFAF